MSSYTLRGGVNAADLTTRWAVFGSALWDDDDAEQLVVQFIMDCATSEPEALRIVRSILAQNPRGVVSIDDDGWYLDVDQARHSPLITFERFAGRHAVVPSVRFGADIFDGQPRLHSSVTLRAKEPVASLT